MSEISDRIERLNIILPVRDRRGQGAVDAVLVGDMLYLSAHLPVDANLHRKTGKRTGCGDRISGGQTVRYEYAGNHKGIYR